MEKRAIITVLGRDKIGIIAAVSGALAQGHANILDINQTIIQDMFTMAMLVDYSQMEPSFDDMRQQLAALGEEMGIEIRMQRKEIFDAMHRV
ncbi:MAG TPA: ACT domain-containing protein [Candidatus Fimadaptatus faecigallinarum]|uniref:UPF0237 protein IAC59_03410 n=1 Tax=Candidatus Fimadaptatus faecigallinarum TaxID=2840814 RepID=A0A9D1LQU7_9FIRM|nr:ACT domain-containing protein [Candidatus Fimadaptatus faecigallinarum]